MRARLTLRFILGLYLLLVLAGGARLRAGDEPARLKVLFLGDEGHHRPAERFGELAPALAARGIDLTYTARPGDLNPAGLAAYDALIVYANIDEIGAAEERALLDFVAGGKGFVPLHCASFCFRNSTPYVELVGAQFLRHGTGVFRTEITGPEHPVMKGFRGFESWDETYVHTRHNEKDRVVLEVRPEAESGAAGGGSEPWTWVRTHGKGRVFYTAWGHDGRTWMNPGFQNLVERGIRWAAGRDPLAVPAFADRPEMTALRTDVKPFEFVEATVPFYPAGERWGTTGEPFHRMQKPLDPGESMKHLVTPVEFEVRLFAADPDIKKAIAMNWDERGRLWISETVDYPNELQPENEGRDRLVICDDADGDGRADRFTVFADKLSLPTSFAFARGGVVVQQPPDTLFLRDTNGDDVADERRVLFTGWSTADTHAGPSNLRYGHDNWLYGIVGYSGYAGEIGGERHSFRQGFYRFRPDGSKLEFLRNTNNNSWGVGLSEEGVLFGSTANGNPSEYMPVANRHYEAVRGWSSSVLRGIAESDRFQAITDKVRQVDYHGRFTAGAGHALYTARLWPRIYWNRAAFVCEPTGHLIATFIIRPEGADFRSRNSWNLFASDDEWCAPIAAEVGPDGNVWVSDWYNFIVQHNPTPAGYRTGKGNAYEIPLRDKTHGRIYRLVARGAPAGRAPRLDAKDPEGLVAGLGNDNMFWRLHAQRLLVERGARDVVPALVRLVADQGTDEIGLNTAAIHALWTLHGLGALDGAEPEALAAATAALRHPSAGVRRNAAQVLPRTGPAAEAAAAAVIASGVASDADGQTRLAALLALAEMPPSPAAAGVALAALADEARARDRWFLDAATAAAARHDRFLLEEAARRGEALALPAAALGRLAIVAEHHARGAPVETIGGLVAALLGARAAIAETVIGGLERGWPKDTPTRLDAAAEAALLPLFDRLPGAGRARLVGLASRLGARSLDERAGEIVDSFLVQVRDDKRTEAERAAAATNLVEFRRSDAATAAMVLDLITPRASPEFATGLLEAAGRSEAPEVGASILERLGALTPAARPVALRVLLARTGWTEALLQALEDGRVQAAELALDQKQALASHPEKRLAERAKRILERGGGLPDPDRQKVLEEFLPVARQAGDAARGKEVYKKLCSKCHVHGEEGTRIGPDLTGMAVHPREELLTQMLDPSRSVEGNFRAYAVITTDGRVLSGLLASETRTSLELFDADGKKQFLRRDEIATLDASSKSLMPDGFEKQMAREEIADLLEFLARPGRFLPLDLRKAATVVSTRGMFFGEGSQAERLVFRDWSPKTFAGVPFVLVDPQEGRVPNVVLLYSPQGRIPPGMPRSVRLPVNVPARAVHFLSGVSGWGFPLGEKGSVTMILRLVYADGATEEHQLRNGEHFADYIRRVDVPGSQFAYQLRGQQLRYLSVAAERPEVIREIELVKGPDETAPIVMAVTVETRG